LAGQNYNTFAEEFKSIPKDAEEKKEGKKK
jgi:hypothetical protein